MTDKITVPAYAKLNLFLEITGKRSDGYHNIESIMQSVSVHDTVTVLAEESSASSVSVACDNPNIPCDERNIAYKAAVQYLAFTGINATIRIAIEKKIPLEGGMGGSSTDGAAVLKALNRIFSNRLSREDLLSLAAGIGADVPFCLAGGTALCKGIGEEITQLQPLANCAILLVKSNESSNTVEAYKRFDELPKSEQRNAANVIDAIKRGALPESCFNRFEELLPELGAEETKRKLLSLGARAASMTGSGSAFFAVFYNREEAESAMQKLDFPYMEICEPVE